MRHWTQQPERWLLNMESTFSAPPRCLLVSHPPYRGMLGVPASACSTVPPLSPLQLAFALCSSRPAAQYAIRFLFLVLLFLFPFFSPFPYSFRGRGGRGGVSSFLSSRSRCRLSYRICDGNRKLLRSVDGSSRSLPTIIWRA